jgi:hypothetical protein
MFTIEASRSIDKLMWSGNDKNFIKPVLADKKILIFARESRE